MLISTRRSIFWRLFWKEYRVQRAFWLCIAVLAVLLMALPAVTVATGGDRLYWRFAVARILPALFAAACGAMLFATEHEAGTYDFQRSLPLSSSRLLLGKCAFALCSVVLLYAVCWLVAVILSGVALREAFANLPGWMPVGMQGRLVHVPVFVSLSFAAELLLWSVLFSLLLRHPLTAAIAGAAAAAATATYITWNAAGPPADRPATQLAVALLLAAADVWLGLRWLSERRITPVRRSIWPRSLKAAPAPFRANSAARTVGRLVWEFWRESRGLRLVLGAIFILCAIDVARFFIPGCRGVVSITVLAIPLSPLFFPLLGSIAFLFDQQGHSYRFLADRGVRPGHVWLSRQLAVWIAAAVPAVPLSVIDAGFATPMLMNTAITPVEASHAASLIYFFNLVPAVFSFALLGVAAGQLCSMLFRNGLLAVFFGLLLSAVLAVWYGLMWLYGLNWFWSVLPIPLALLLATRLRTPHWLVERNTIRAWCPTALALLLPAAGLLVAVPLYRGYQIPAVGPGFSPEEYLRQRPLTTEEQATLDLYERAFQSLDDRHWGKSRAAWLKDNAKAIALTLEASRNKEFNFRVGQAQNERLMRYVDSLADHVTRSASELERQGDLDAAMEQYLAVIGMSAQIRRDSPAQSMFSVDHPDKIEREVLNRLPYWAARPRQTPERILAAARALDKLTSDLSPDTAGVKSEYLRLRRALSGGYAAIIQEYGDQREAALLPLTDIWSRLPWERTRALRLLDLRTRQYLDQLAEAQAQAEGGVAVTQQLVRSRDLLGEENPYRPQELPFALRNEIHVPPIQGLLPYEQAARIRNYTVMVALRRGVRLSLVLEAWKLQHGSLPKSLTELFAPASTFSARCSTGFEVSDPFTGNLFRYVPAGVGIPFKWECHGISYFADGEIAANVPFVWSAGPRVAVPRFNDTSQGRQAELELNNYHILDDPWGYDQRRHSPSSEYDLWEAGIPIPVP